MYSSNYVKCVLPTELTSAEILSKDFDYIFFTGSTFFIKAVIYSYLQVKTRIVSP